MRVTCANKKLRVAELHSAFNNYSKLLFNRVHVEL